MNFPFDSLKSILKAMNKDSANKWLLLSVLLILAIVTSLPFNEITASLQEISSFKIMQVIYNNKNTFFFIAAMLSLFQAVSFLLTLAFYFISKRLAGLFRYLTIVIMWSWPYITLTAIVFSNLSQSHLLTGFWFYLSSLPRMICDVCVFFIFFSIFFNIIYFISWVIQEYKDDHNL